MSRSSARAMVFTGVGEPLTLREFSLPEPQGAEALVRVVCCTVCGHDLHAHTGHRPVPTPTILGHEVVGTIAALGPDAEAHDFNGAPLTVGDRVTWTLTAACGDCFYCNNDQSEKCERLFKYGHEVLKPGHQLSGGLAEYCLLAEGTDIFRLPDGLPDTVACPANCATATIAAALRTAGDMTGIRVLVQGAGMMGLTACAMARTAGAETVLCCDILAERLVRAADFGATHSVLCLEEHGLQQAVLEATGESGVDVAIEVSGARAAFSAGLNVLHEGGTYLLIGTKFPGSPAAHDLEIIVQRHLLLHGVHDYIPQDLAAALQFLTENGSRFPFVSLVAQSFPLAEAETAFMIARQKSLIRVAVTP